MAFKCGLSGEATQVGGVQAMVVTYDPDAGFVTGGGWIDSPGAWIADPSLVVRVNFGFVSKYRKGAVAPTGETEVQFKLAGLNFHSTAYEWLVVSGTSKAQYKGVGKVNGAGSYGFLLTAYDGGSTGQDKLRIKIWDRSNGDAVVYDNRMAASSDLDLADPQAIAGGSIVIHTGKK